MAKSSRRTMYASLREWSKSVCRRDIMKRAAEEGMFFSCEVYIK